jgi:hypothetical protein
MRTLLLRLREPSSLMLVAANAVPVIGVLLWRWDAFQLLILYWMETAILGFWAIAAVAMSPEKTLGSFGKTTSRIGIVLFLLLHSGIFMGVHFMILWKLFAGDWTGRIHSVGDFLRLMVLGQGLWLPLLMLFLMRGLMVLLAIRKPKRSSSMKQRPRLVGPKDVSAFLAVTPLFGFYIRIIIMQFVLILGGAIAVFMGAGAALVLLVVIKTAIDLGLLLNMDEWAAAQSR